MLTILGQETVTPTRRPAPHSAPRRSSRMQHHIKSDRLFPSLAASTLSSDQVCLHLPRVLRYFFQYYKIDTVGKLSSMSVQQVQDCFPIQDSVGKIIKALVKVENRVKATSAADARRLYCSPLRKVVPGSPRKGRSLGFTSPPLLHTPRSPQASEWSVESKLVRHLEKAQHYLKMYAESKDVVPEVMDMVIGTHCKAIMAKYEQFTTTESTLEEAKTDGESTLELKQVLQ